MTIAIISMIRESWGGSEELWAAMADEALATGHKVTHLSYDYKPLHPKMQSLIDNGLITYIRPGYKPVYRNPVLRIIHRAFFFLQKRINRSMLSMFAKNPDVILYNGTCYSIAGEKQLLKHLKKSRAAFFHLGHFNRDDGGDLPSSQITAIEQAYSRSKNVLFITQRSIQNARRRLITGIPNALVVRNPVNINSTELIPFPTSGTIQFAMAGNLVVVHKGQDIALEALATTAWQQRDWHLNIYGSGEDEAHLKKFADFLGLANKVTFHGRVSDIREVWKLNHVLLMPSHMEGMPLAVVEAMICGRPTVVTDVGGNREWIEDGIQGFIADAPTVFSFGNAMERAWKAKDAWPDIGVKAHEKAMKLYDAQPGKTLLRLLTGE